MKSSVVVSYGRNVTVSCEKCITAIRIFFVAEAFVPDDCAPAVNGMAVAAAAAVPRPSKARRLGIFTT